MKITEIDIEELNVSEVSVSELNLDNAEEHIRMLQVLNKGCKIFVERKNMYINLEKGRLYHAIVYSNPDSETLYKDIINLNNDPQVSEDFDNYLLPVGTVVKTQNGDNMLIISRAIEKEGEYIEYVGCDSIYGFSVAEPIGFKHEDVVQVLSLPYMDQKILETTIQIKKWLDNKKKE